MCLQEWFTLVHYVVLVVHDVSSMSTLFVSVYSLFKNVWELTCYRNLVNDLRTSKILMARQYLLIWRLVANMKTELLHDMVCKGIVSRSNGNQSGYGRNQDMEARHMVETTCTFRHFSNSPTQASLQQTRQFLWPENLFAGNTCILASLMSHFKAWNQWPNSCWNCCQCSWCGTAALWKWSVKGVLWRPKP